MSDAARDRDGAASSSVLHQSYRRYAASLLFLGGKEKSTTPLLSVGTKKDADEDEVDWNDVGRSLSLSLLRDGTDAGPGAMALEGPGTGKSLSITTIDGSARLGQFSDEFVCRTCGSLLLPGVGGTTVRLRSMKRGRTRRRRASRYKAKQAQRDAQSQKHRRGGREWSNVTSPSADSAAAVSSSVGDTSKADEERRQDRSIRRVTDGTCRNCVVYTCGFCGGKLRLKGLGVVSNPRLRKRDGVKEGQKRRLSQDRETRRKSETAGKVRDRNVTPANRSPPHSAKERRRTTVVQDQQTRKEAEQFTGQKRQREQKIGGSQFTSHSFAGKDLKALLKPPPGRDTNADGRVIAAARSDDGALNLDSDFVPLGGGGSGPITTTTKGSSSSQNPSRRRSSEQLHQAAITPTRMRLDEVTPRKRGKKKKKGGESSDRGKKSGGSHLMDFLSSLND